MKKLCKIQSKAFKRSINIGSLIHTLSTNFRYFLSSNIELLELWKTNFEKISMLSLIIFTVVSFSWQTFFYLDYGSLLKSYFLFQNQRRAVGLYRSWNVWLFILEWSLYFLIAWKSGLAISELAILLAKVSSISKFSTILLKC